MNYPVLILNLYMQFLSLRCIFFLLKQYLDTDTALKVSQSVYCFTSISHGVENNFPTLWDMGISDAIFNALKFMKSCTKSLITRKVLHLEHFVKICYSATFSIVTTW